MDDLRDRLKALLSGRTRSTHAIARDMDITYQTLRAFLDDTKTTNTTSYNKIANWVSRKEGNIMKESE